MKNKRLIAAIVVAGLAVAGSAAAIQTGGRPWMRVAAFDNSTLYKVCDSGRMIYVIENHGSERGGHGVTVVPDARECNFR